MKKAIYVKTEAINSDKNEITSKTIQIFDVAVYLKTTLLAVSLLEKSIFIKRTIEKTKSEIDSMEKISAKNEEIGKI